MSEEADKIIESRDLQIEETIRLALGPLIKAREFTLHLEAGMGSHCITPGDPYRKIVEGVDEICVRFKLAAKILIPYPEKP